MISKAYEDNLEYLSIIFSINAAGATLLAIFMQKMEASSPHYTIHKNELKKKITVLKVRALVHFWLGDDFLGKMPKAQETKEKNLSALKGNIKKMKTQPTEYEKTLAKHMYVARKLFFNVYF